MEVGFGLRNAGPLTQISLQLIIPGTAVWLATGAYGWWKARERSQSLTQVLGAAGASLVSTTSFDLPTYIRCRKVGNVHGVVVQSGELQRAILPEASTATPSDSGLACLRALVTGLTCYYTTTATTTILSEVLPSTLINQDQEGETPTFEGSLLSTLKYLIEAIAAEEDSHSFRDHLNNHVKRAETALLGDEEGPKTDFEELYVVDENEVAHVIGLLRWVLEARHKRDRSIYPTRSLRVWLVAVVLQKLGFEVSALFQLCQTEEDYEQVIDQSSNHSKHGDVVLVTAPVGDTDPLLLRTSTRDTRDVLRPQTVPHKAIPWTVFRPFCHSKKSISLTKLAEIWDYAYETTREAIEGVHVKDDISWIQTHFALNSSPKKLTSFRQSLVSLWKPQLQSLCSKAVDAFVPAEEMHSLGWTVDEISNNLTLLRSGKAASLLGTQTMVPCSILLSIMLGTVFGVASRAVHNGDSSMDFSSDIAIAPDILYNSTSLDKWIDTIGEGLNGHLRHPEWNRFLVSVILSRIDIYRQPGSSRELPILGGCSNGITAVSRAVMRPSLSYTDVIQMHVGRGQLLNIPRTSDGLIVAGNQDRPTIELTLPPESKVTDIAFGPPSLSKLLTRVDAEPFWENNSQELAFYLRSRGLVTRGFNLLTAIERLYSARPHAYCFCKNPRRSCEVSSAKRWHSVSAAEILRHTAGQITLPPLDNIVVEVTEGESQLLAVLGTIECRNLVVCFDCVPCAESAIARLNQHRSRHQRDASNAIILVNDAQFVDTGQGDG